MLTQINLFSWRGLNKLTRRVLIGVIEVGVVSRATIAFISCIVLSSKTYEIKRKVSKNL